MGASAISQTSMMRRADGTLTSFPRLTPERRAEVARVLEETGNLSAAADAVGVSRQGLYEARLRDPAFDAVCIDAIERANDRLEAVVRKRAERGTKRGVWYKGELVGHERETHDNLSMFMLKAHRPDRYRPDVAVQVGVGLSVESTAKLSDQELEAVVLRAKGNTFNVLPEPSRNYLEATESAPSAPKGPNRAKGGRGRLTSRPEGDPKESSRRPKKRRKQKQP